MRGLLTLCCCIFLGWAFAMLFRSCQLAVKVDRDTKRDIEWGDQVRQRVEDYMNQPPTQAVAAHEEK